MPHKKIVPGQQVDPKKQQRARELRRSMTTDERRLWDRLRANRLDGWHFRRQQIIAGFIVDFYCHQAGLVIEVDGEIHAKQKAQDAVRTDALSKHGLKVLRFRNQDVMNNLEVVLGRISENLPTPSPLPIWTGELDEMQDGADFIT